MLALVDLVNSSKITYKLRCHSSAFVPPETILTEFLALLFRGNTNDSEQPDSRWYSDESCG